MSFGSSCRSGNEPGNAASSAAGISLVGAAVLGLLDFILPMQALRERHGAHPGVQKSKVCWRFSKGVGSMSSNAMCGKTTQNNKEQVSSPRKQVSESFLKCQRKYQTPRTGKKGAETLKVGIFFAFCRLVFQPNDLMGCGRYMGEFSPSNPPIKILTGPVSAR